MYPQDLKFSREHHWVKLEGGQARIGLSDFSQSQMGALVYFELPQVGDKVTAGEAYGSMESTKAVSDINAPLSGEVVEINESLEDEPQKVNQDPYGEGWTIKLKLDDPAQVEGLLEPEAYRQLAEELAAKRKKKG